MQVREIMTKSPEVVDPGTTLADVAKKMRDLDVGDMPVMQDGSIVGMVTDRDITIRGVAEGVDVAHQAVEDIMSKGVTTVEESRSAEEAAELMEKEQIRRLPVVGDDGHLVGILSLGDLAVAKNEKTAGEAIKEVSKPAEPKR